MRSDADLLKLFQGVRKQAFDALCTPVTEALRSAKTTKTASELTELDRALLIHEAKP